MKLVTKQRQRLEEAEISWDSAGVGGVAGGCCRQKETERAALEQPLAELPEGGNYLACSVNTQSTHLPALG